MLLSEFFKKLLAIAPIVENIVGKNNVETVCLDLPNDLDRISSIMYRRNAKHRQHNAQRAAGIRVSVDK